MTEPDITLKEENTESEASVNKRIRQAGWMVIGLIAIFLLGLGSGYLKWGRSVKSELNVAVLQEQINPVDGYALPVSYGDLGPRMLEGGVF
ncbi:MAG TPA: hypothetical protein VFY83_00280, partial [Anaerolineales bacterium]|nr:hypothetical protein [Anaerolineales bacterium]